MVNKNSIWEYNFHHFLSLHLSLSLGDGHQFLYYMYNELHHKLQVNDVKLTLFIQNSALSTQLLQIITAQLLNNEAQLLNKSQINDLLCTGLDNKYSFKYTSKQSPLNALHLTILQCIAAL